MSFILYCISKYDIIRIFIFIRILKYDAISISFCFVFQNMVLNELHFILYLEI